MCYNCTSLYCAYVILIPHLSFYIYVIFVYIAGFFLHKIQIIVLS